MVRQQVLAPWTAGSAFADAHGFRTEWMGRDHPERQGLQEFIAASFFESYGAQVRFFLDMLVGCRTDDGEWIAALGFSLAQNGRTFLEQYLDVPLENAIAAQTRVPVCRDQIVEVGNLAATHVGAGRDLIVRMTRFLHDQGLSWVAFTATPGLLNSFTRLRLNPHVLAEADPQRLPDGGKSWGSYYASQPQVMFGDIGAGYAQLA